MTIEIQVFNEQQRAIADLLWLAFGKLKSNEERLSFLTNLDPPTGEDALIVWEMFRLSFIDAIVNEH